MNKRIPHLFLFSLIMWAFCIPASAKEVIAKIYGRDIYREEVQGPRKSLTSLILYPLFERYAAENSIVVTEAEIDEFLTSANMRAEPSTPPEQREMMRGMARSFVLNWKISKALYKKYGGDVIFQQSNPLEPVGATRRFLEEKEKAGAFQIFNVQERTKFFEYYVRKHGSVIPPSQVNYEKPWWRK